MAKYRYTEKSVFFKTETGQERRISKKTHIQYKKMVQASNRARKKTIQELYKQQPDKQNYTIEQFEKYLVEKGVVSHKLSQDLTKTKGGPDIQRQMRTMKKITTGKYTKSGLKAKREEYASSIDESGFMLPSGMRDPVKRSIRNMTDAEFIQFMGMNNSNPVPMLYGSEKYELEYLEQWIEGIQSRIDVVTK